MASPSTIKEEVATPPTLEETLSPTLADPTVSGLNDTVLLPDSPTEFQQWQFHSKQAGRPPVYFIQYITQRLVRYQKQLEDECSGGEQAVYDIIHAIYMLQQSETFTFEDYQKLNIEFILKTVMEDCPGAKGPFSYPGPLQVYAAVVLEAAERHKPTVPEVKQDEHVPVSNSTGDSSSAPRPRAHKRRRTNDPSQQQPLVIPTQDMEAILRGLVLTNPDTGRRTWSLDKTVPARSCNVVGHNGIAIGTWWPYRICAIRDGAHGASMAGIAGSIADGAYSVVVSGSYADLDRDLGDTLYYSGSKAHDNTDPKNPILSTSTRALQTSKREDRSVRVLRAAGGDIAYAPSVGMRYDGLYRIMEELLPLNHKGGRYARFKLVRNADQDPIDLTRPTARERAIFEKLKEQR